MLWPHTHLAINANTEHRLWRRTCGPSPSSIYNSFPPYIQEPAELVRFLPTLDMIEKNTTAPTFGTRTWHKSDMDGNIFNSCSSVHFSTRISFSRTCIIPFNMIICQYNHDCSPIPVWRASDVLMVHLWASQDDMTDHVGRGQYIDPPQLVGHTHLEPSSKCREGAHYSFFQSSKIRKVLTVLYYFLQAWPQKLVFFSFTKTKYEAMTLRSRNTKFGGKLWNALTYPVQALPFWLMMAL